MPTADRSFIFRVLIGFCLFLFLAAIPAEAGKRVKVKRKPRVRTSAKTTAHPSAQVEAGRRSSGTTRTRTRSRTPVESNSGQGGANAASTNTTRSNQNPQTTRQGNPHTDAFGTGTPPPPRKLWEITPAGTAEVRRSGKTIYAKSKSDGLWWSKDWAGHGTNRATGGTVSWKVFKEEGKGLRWIADADQYGKFITDKHKGDVGMFIPWKDLGRAR